MRPTGWRNNRDGPASRPVRPPPGARLARKLVVWRSEDRLTTEQPADEGHMPRAQLWQLAGPVALLRPCAQAALFGFGDLVLRAGL